MQLGQSRVASANHSIQLTTSQLRTQSLYFGAALTKTNTTRYFVFHRKGIRLRPKYRRGSLRDRCLGHSHRPSLHMQFVSSFRCQWKISRNPAVSRDKQSQRYSRLCLPVLSDPALGILRRQTIRPKEETTYLTFRSAATILG